ncbi:ATP-binding SpoIIE family protein phosphatase [Merismopedia glauca]|uniref:ATP-binding SpoIIE family protein phosphatase n=1 Tax=Merismopedia glauca TaxID=292586 RepID=UPI001FE3D89D|nr:SpoIIE family protein phosphatase [Merismopedia glauca]
MIFACAIAAIVIYSVSFWHMRQLTQQGVLSWMIEVAESRIETVAAEITIILQSIEQNAEMVVQADVKNQNTLNQSIKPFLKTSIAQKSAIQAVAIKPLSIGNRETTPLGVQLDDRKVDRAMSDRDLTSLLARCQNNSTPTKPFWTQPNLKSSKSLVMSYCRPLWSGNSPESVKPGMLAIALNLDWLPPLVTSKLEVTDKFHHLKMGQPFVIALPTKQWLVSPSKSTQSLSWFSPQNATKDIWDASSNLSTPQTLVDSQGISVFTTLPSTSWAFGIAFPDAELRLFQDKYIRLMIISMLKDMVLMCVAIVIVSQRTIRPLRALIASTEDIAQGNLDTILPVIAQRDEVGRLTQAFRHMRDSLKIHIQELKETTAAKQAMESELLIAGQIQRSMVPRVEVSDDYNRRYQLSALLQPARQVGGDLYDFFLLECDRLCLIVGDVADKGVPAALLMARTVTLIRRIAHQTSTPTQILTAVNRELCTDNEECLFVTLFCSVLDLNTGKLDYASGGHDAPLLLRDRTVQFLDLETGSPLGLEEEAIFPEHECWLKSNDLLLLYTDGITEAMNRQGDLFTEARLIEAIAYYPLSTPARTIRTIQHFHQQFIANAPQSDDITLLALQYQPSSPFAQEVKFVEWKITIDGELTELERVKPYLGEILQEEYLTVESIEDAQLIVEEVLVNIIQHGYENQECDRIDLQVKIGSATLKMIFEDRGKPFNPLTEIDMPDLSMDDDRRSFGGLGFYLVRELADRIDYIYDDGKNILTVFQSINKVT